MYNEGGGDSRQTFGQGCATDSFKMVPMARQMSVKVLSLALLSYPSKVP